MPALTFGNIDEYENLTDEEIVPSDQRRIIEQNIYSSLEDRIWKINENNWRTRVKTNKGTWRVWETSS